MASDESEVIVNTLTEFTSRIVAFRDARDWAQFHGPKDELLSLVAEVGELAELFRWFDGDALRASIEGNQEAIGDELADVLYWVLLIAHDAGIDLSTAFEAKMAKNEAKYPVHAAKGSAKKYDELDGFEER